MLLPPLLVGVAARSEAEGDWCEAWVEHAARVSLRHLEAQVDDALLARETAPEAWQACRDHPERFGDDLPRRAAHVCADSEREADPGSSGESVRLTIAAPREVARLFRATLCTLRRALERETGRLPSEGEGLEAMLDHALRSWGADDPWLARIEGEAPAGLTFALGLRPGLPPLERYRAGDRRLP